MGAPTGKHCVGHKDELLDKEKWNQVKLEPRNKLQQFELRCSEKLKLDESQLRTSKF